MDHQSKPPVSPSLTSGLPAPAHLYLASQSPRRRELLGQIGVTPILLLPDEDEDAEALEQTRSNESARDYVERVTRAKAHAAAHRWQRRCLPRAPILCADTTVTIDGQILGKPKDAADAARILRLLSGRRHQVLTAVTLWMPRSTSHDDAFSDASASPIAFALSTSEVQFSLLDDNSIQRYIDSGEPFGKAGAYGIQGRGAAFIAHLNGSYSGVMGLPLFETAQLLRQAGLNT